MTATLNPRTHPHKSLLESYCVGIATEDEVLFMNAHLALCPHCRQQMQSFDTKAGINLEDMPLEEMDVNCLENLLQKIDEHGPPACIDVTIPINSPAPSIIPEPLLPYVGSALDPMRWRDLGDGVFVYQSLKEFPGSIHLMRFAKGASIEVIGHGMLLILEGEIRTLMNSHGPGDIVKNNWIPSLGRKAYRELIGLIA